MIAKPPWGHQTADCSSTWKLSRQKSPQYTHARLKLVNSFHAYLIEFCIFCITGHGDLSSMVICKTRKTQQRSGFACFWILPSSGKIKTDLTHSLSHSVFLTCSPLPEIKRLCESNLNNVLVREMKFFCRSEWLTEEWLDSIQGLGRNVCYFLHYTKWLKHCNWKWLWTGLTGPIN